ncbi:MAG: right-handed parallel beta-helix repeat-containing protein, partial [Planctomycetes bacterium]|nr:right-handed parallel beta-helix repeat-containing protein [Planctomycetota bacterium]
MFLAKRVLLGVALAVSSVVGSGPTYGVDRFVDAAATGPDHNGRSWCTAFLTLQDALEPGVLLSGDQVLVAQGTYYPDTTLLLDARDATFQLVPNIRINGGYAGCAEPVPGVRDLKAYETILSGDLARDDFLPGGGMDENAYHVITGDGNVGNATLDGVTITAGNANGSSFESRGGGVFNKNGAAPIFRNCTIRGNHATSGGGMFNQFSSPTLINCVIAENVASAGAGLFDSADARLDGSTIINCLIRDNQATGGQGGGVYAFGADTEILRSTVVRNSASGGAGLFNWSSILALKDCILWGNDDNGTVDQLAQLRDFNAVSTTVNYTCMQGWDGTLGGTENFGDDPLFAVGPLGCYYLSQTLAGESADSLCVDAGSNTAASYGLAGRTTRSDAVGD